jgi:WD40 repeat protein
MNLVKFYFSRLIRSYQIHLPYQFKLCQLIEEASRLGQIFASSIEEHPLLLYLIALPSIPTHTLLYQTFVNRDTPWTVGGFRKAWPLLLHTLRGHSDEVQSVAFFPDGTRILSSSRDGTICVFDVTTGAEIIAPLTVHTGSVNSSAVSPDSLRIVTGSNDHTVRLWHANTGQEILPPFQGHTDEVFSVAFSPDGTRIVSASADHTVRVWNPISGSEALAPLRGHNDIVSTVLFTPDANRIVSGSWDKTIRVWDVVRGAEILHPFQGHEGAVYSVAVSRDGQSIASSSADGSIFIWDAINGHRTQALQAAGAPSLVSVTFFPCGKRIAANTSSNPRPRICVWDVISGAQVYESSVEYPIACISLSPSGNRFGIGCFDGTVVLWDAASLDTNSARLRSRAIIIAMAFSADGKCIASCSDQDFNICLRDAQSGMEILPPLQGHDKEITSLAFSPDDRLIASTSVDTTIRVWNTTTGAEVPPSLRGHEHSVLCVAFSPDGTQIVSGSSDKTIRLWGVISGTQIISPLLGHEDSIQGVAFSPDGTLVASGSAAGCVRMWNLMSCTETLRFTMGHGPDYPTSVAFSPDGRYIFAKFWKWVRVWDSSEAHFTQTPNYLHDRCTFKDAIIITPEGWIVDVATQKIVSKLPSMVSVWKYAASRTSIAFTMSEMKSVVSIVHFPPNALTSPGTWNPFACELNGGDKNSTDHGAGPSVVFP